MPFLGDMVGAGAGGGSGYTIDNAVRLDGSADYLSRTPGSAGNRKTGTFNAWIKGPLNSSDSSIFTAYQDGSNFSYVQHDGTSGSSRFVVGHLGSWACIFDGAVRDSTAHGMLTVVWDTTQATNTNRVKLYWNGSSLTQSGLSTYPDQNSDVFFNHSVAHYMGTRSGSSLFLSGYITHPILVDGAALTPSSFGETDAVTGSWKPKAPSGLTYGTNGFWLDFANTADLGNDVSGNNNDWTPNSLGSTDAVADTPTNNFAVWNALRPSTSILSNGNRTAEGTASGTIPVSQSDKWYWEITAGATGVTAGLVNAAGTTYTTSVGNGTTVSFRYTHSTATLESSTDGSSWSTVSSSVSGTAFPYATGGSNTVNFGATAFLRTPPAGFKAMCTDNMAATTGISSGSFTGNASADGPFVWTGAPPATLTIDGSAVTLGTHADKTAGGFKIRTASSPYNDAATNNWTATYSTPQSPFVGSNKVPGTAQGNP